MAPTSTSSRRVSQGRGTPLGSHKYRGKYVLRYELEVDILVGTMVWVEGPYPAGVWPGVKVFNSVLSHCLEPGEQVEANKGYVGHPNKNQVSP
jgi:hypothetical protein